MNIQRGVDRAHGWHAIRDRWLSNPAFQRWAAAFPLTRPIAERKARALFDLCAGFVYSQVLAACVELRVFDELAHGPRTTADLAARLRLDEMAAKRLLDAAAALDLVEHRGADSFGLGPLGAALVANPGIAALVEHHAVLYADLAEPVRLLRDGQPTQLAKYWPYAQRERPATLTNDDVAAYSNLMAASQSLVATDIIDAYPFARHRCLLDVGGGEGTFLAAVARRAPALQLQLFDLPAVVTRARQRMAVEAPTSDVKFVGGDFFDDELPRGADIVTLVRVLHDHDDDRVSTLLRAVRDALDRGGTLVVAEPMAGARGARAMGDAYFGIYLYAMRSGRPREARRIVELLVAAGFRHVRIIETRRPLLTGLIAASR